MKTKWMFLSQDAAGGGKVANEEIFRIIRLRFSDISVRSYLPTLPKLSFPFKYTKQLLLFYIFFYRKLKSVNSEMFDAIISTSIPALLALRWTTLESAPTVYLFHGEKFSRLRMERLSGSSTISALRFFYSRFFYNFLVKRINLYALRRVSKIATFSNWAKEYLLRTYGINSENIKVIPQGVNHFLFYPLSASKRRELRKQIGIGLQQRVVFYPGRIDPYRGVHRLIDAVKLIQSFDPTVVLLLAILTKQADPIYLKKIRAKIQTLLSYQVIIRFNISHGKELAKLYAASDVVIRPSDPGTEVAPLVALEALACGVPFIGTRVGNIPELLEPIDKRLILKDNKPQTIARSLQYLFSLNPRELAKIKQRGIDIAANYSWEKTARELALLISHNRARESFCDDVVMG